MLLQTPRGSRYRRFLERIRSQDGTETNHFNQEIHLHFVGIGGIGMSGIAEVFHNQNYRVSGSDIAESETTRRLEKIGIQVTIGHREENVLGSNVVVISSAVGSDNPEVIQAKRDRIPVIPRAEMLGELMRGKIGVAVAGTHGKTSTTSILSSIFSVADLDPTLVIGGRVDSIGGNARFGQGDFVIAEADESDGSFRHLPATLAIVTNIDSDHLDYFGNISEIDSAFIEFVGKLPFYGHAVICGEDAGVKRCLSQFQKPTFTYGLSNQWDYYADTLVETPDGTQFKVYKKNGDFFGSYEIHLPGRHHVLNALSAIVIADLVEIPMEKIIQGIHAFAGVKRRYETIWEDADRAIRLVDDYAHHPTEIVETLKAARSRWPGRIISIFQPHRFSRTLHCKDGFVAAFSDSDVVLITDIYAAGETPIDGISAKLLVQEMQERGGTDRKVLYCPDFDSICSTIQQEVCNGDLIFTLGAGSISKLPSELKKILA